MAANIPESFGANFILPVKLQGFLRNLVQSVVVLLGQPPRLVILLESLPIRVRKLACDFHVERRKCWT